MIQKDADAFKALLTEASNKQQRITDNNTM